MSPPESNIGMPAKREHLSAHNAATPFFHCHFRHRFCNDFAAIWKSFWEAKRNQKGNNSKFHFDEKYNKIHGVRFRIWKIAKAARPNNSLAAGGSALIPKVLLYQIYICIAGERWHSSRTPSSWEWSLWIAYINCVLLYGKYAMRLRVRAMSPLWATRLLRTDCPRVWLYNMWLP